jgi:hypothetical protein
MPLISQINELMNDLLLFSSCIQFCKSYFRTERSIAHPLCCKDVTEPSSMRSRGPGCNQKLDDQALRIWSLWCIHSIVLVHHYLVVYNTIGRMHRARISFLTITIRPFFFFPQLANTNGNCSYLHTVMRYKNKR